MHGFVAERRPSSLCLLVTLLALPRLYTILFSRCSFTFISITYLINRRHHPTPCHYHLLFPSLPRSSRIPANLSRSTSYLQNIFLLSSQHTHLSLGYCPYSCGPGLYSLLHLYS
ncbi:hypothetical protein F4677DRAFT_345593 [Hypoxylon crocopeplum]|nr:hypothetical protein F4677DRAFT_345593 [Hypoxylon crocopeplum]